MRLTVSRTEQLYLYDRQTYSKCLVLATYCVLFLNVIQSVDLSEFSFIYDCMVGLHMVCFIAGMNCYRCILKLEYSDNNFCGIMLWTLMF